MRLFWTLTFSLLISILRTQIEKEDQSENFNNTKHYNVTWFRRGSSSAALGKRKNGSMTVEASMVVPLFVFCIVNLLFGIQIIETSSRITAAIHETGNEICSYGYAIQNSLGENLPVGIGSTIYVSSAVAHKLGDVTNKRGGIKGGVTGISYLGTSVMDGDGMVKISTSYSIKYPVNMGINTIRLGTSYYGHAWVGYEVSNDVSRFSEEDPIVYVTPSGTVYHVTTSCSHLNPSISSVSRESVGQLRSKDGSNYYPCELCGNGSGVGNVFITDYGNRYHSNLYCSGIKRNIKAVHLSEVGGRRQCMTCG